MIFLILPLCVYLMVFDSAPKNFFYLSQKLIPMVKWTIQDSEVSKMYPIIIYTKNKKSNAKFFSYNSVIEDIL